MTAMTAASPASETARQKQQQIEASLASIREALLTLRYGSIMVTVHDGRIVQIDVTERRRLKTTN